MARTHGTLWLALFALTTSDPAAAPARQSRPAAAEQLRGEVVDAAGKPAPGAVVHLLRWPLETLPESLQLQGVPDGAVEIAAATVAPDGSFRVPVDEGRRYGLYATRGAKEISRPWSSLIAGDWLRLALEPARSLRGGVFATTEQGKKTGLGGAVVAAAIPTTSLRPALARFVHRVSAVLAVTTRTEDDGSFCLLVPPPEAGSPVAVTANQGTRPGVGLEADHATTELELVFPALVERHGILVDGGGRPVAGARIMESLQPCAVSDADGRFVVETPRERLLQVVADDLDRLVLHSNELAPRAETAKTIQLRSGPRLAARLLRADGTPLTGARLRLFAPGRGTQVTWPNYDWTDRVGADGRISIALVQGGQFAGWVDVDGVFVRFVAGVAGAAQGDVHLGDVRLATDGRIEGRILTADGSPVPEGAVFVRPQPDENVMCQDATFPSRIVLADRTGRFAVTGLLPGPYSLMAAAVGDGVCFAEVHAGTSPRLDLRLGDEGTIAGTVLDADGEPVARAVVCATSKQYRGRTGPGRAARFGINSWYSESNSAGRFVLKGLPDEIFALEATAQRDGIMLSATHPGRVAVGTADLDLFLER